MLLRRLSLATTLLAGFACLGPVYAQDLGQRAIYRLRLVDAEAPRVAVEAHVRAGERLSMWHYGAWSQARGWASFVHGLEVRDGNGSLGVTPVEGGWSVEGAPATRLTIAYEVDLSHVGWPEWPEGPRTTAAYRDGDALFSLAACLLVYTDESEPCELRFEGEEWGRVVTPFQRTGSGFEVESVGRAASNLVAFGALEHRELQVGGTRVHLVQFGGDTPLLAEVCRLALESFAELFGNERPGQFLAVVYPDGWHTGEAYADSFVLATTRPLAEDDVALWGQSIAHEVFHRWLGSAIRGASWADSNWFSEGVTDYMASLFLVRLGIVGPEVFLDQLEKHASFYRLFRKGPPFSGSDLVTAGRDKGTNNAAVYDGGWLTAFALDLELRERTEGAVGLEDFLRELFEFCTLVEGGYETDDLVGLLDEVSGTDFAPFFADHVTGTRPLDLPSLCVRAGITLRLGAEQSHARLDPEASPEAARIRARLFSGAFGPAPTGVAAQIDALFADFLAPGSPGASLTVLHEDRIVRSRGYGLADLERPRPIEPTTVFHAASVSKQFTAFAVLLLEAEGRLSTADPVLDWLPELACGQGIEVRHLLDHTSGMRDQWQLLGLCGVRPNGDVITQEDVLALLFRQEELGFAPGSEQAYCNSGYTLLAEIVTRASGTPFPRFVRERIFEPLGMEHTFFQESPRPVVPGRALSYAATEEGFEHVPIAFGTYGATGLMTTTEDLVRWARNAWELRVGSRAVYDRMLERGRLDDGTEVDFTRGLQVRSWGEELVFGHPGADAGYRSAIVVAPSERLAVALLGNVDSVDMWGLPDRVLELFLGAPDPEPEEEEELEPESGEPAPPRATAMDLAELVGSYHSRELDTSYELELVNGALQARHLRNGVLSLEVAGEDRLSCDRWYLGELTFERDVSGTVIAFRASSARSQGVRFERAR